MALAPEKLQQLGLFGGFEDAALRYLAERLDEVDFPSGSTVFREGDSGRQLFVVLDGEMEVLKRGRNQADARIAILGPGDWFGEMSVIDVQARSATVRVVSPARLVSISATLLDDLYRHDTKSYLLLVLNIARELSRRLRVADGILAELVLRVVERDSPAAS
jgi:CRP-like cAMP-binding protein